MSTTEDAGVLLARADLTAKITNIFNPTADEFVRHDIYFFKDGNVTFLVDGTLYCVHRYFFSRDSVYFSTKFFHLKVRDHESLSTIISLSDTDRKDFEAFLSVIYPVNFEEHDLSYEQWKSILHLSTRWGFASLRNLALRSIKPPTAFDQLLLARTYNVDHWVLPALSALCARAMPIGPKEARQMSIEDVVVVATVREGIRTQMFFVDSAGIIHRIKAAQALVAHVASDDVTPGGTPVSSETVEKKPSKEAVVGIGAKADSYNVTEAAEPIPSKAEWYSATRPYSVFPGGAGLHPPVSNHPSMGLPAMNVPTTGSLAPMGQVATGVPTTEGSAVGALMDRPRSPPWSYWSLYKS